MMCNLAVRSLIAIVFQYESIGIIRLHFRTPFLHFLGFKMLLISVFLRCARSNDLFRIMIPDLSVCSVIVVIFCKFVSLVWIFIGIQEGYPSCAAPVHTAGCRKGLQRAGLNFGSRGRSRVCDNHGSGWHLSQEQKLIILILGFVPRYGGGPEHLHFPASVCACLFVLYHTLKVWLGCVGTKLDPPYGIRAGRPTFCPKAVFVDIYRKGFICFPLLILVPFTSGNCQPLLTCPSNSLLLVSELRGTWLINGQVSRKSTQLLSDVKYVLA